MKIKYLLIALLTVLSVYAYAQNGKIRGTVFDASNGETLVGVNIVIKGTTVGTTTDLDGKFSLEVEAGTHTIEISFISYQSMTIEDVHVKSGEITALGDLQMNEDALELEEVIVSVRRIQNTEGALQTMKRKSPEMIDGISSEKMKLIGDGTAVEAAKRVTGVSIEGGKYVYVRGLGDRYTKTTLNGVEIPGLDPDKNSIQMDIFPTSLIDNITISKNFTAELPADFTGGLVDIVIKDFPEKKIFDVSAGISYTPGVNLSSDYLTYNGGNLDFLGFDDGTRALPDGAGSDNIPTPISGHSGEEVNDFVNSFDKELGTKTAMSLPDISLGLTIGDQIELDKDNMDKNPKLGYIFSISYKMEHSFYDNYLISEYQRYIDPSKYELRYATIQNGQMGERNVLIGGMGGIAYKTNFSKIRLTAMHLQNGESRSALYNIDNDGEAVGQSGYLATSHNLEFNQRSISNVLLNGKHKFNESNWEIDWRVSPTYSSSYDPDIRKTAFTQTINGPEFSAGAGGNPSRIWRYLDEINATAKIDITKKYFLAERKAKLKFGASHSFKYRDYKIMKYDIQFFGSGAQNWPSSDPSDVLITENIYPNDQKNIYYQAGNSDPNPNEYQSNVNNTGVYVSNEFEPFRNFKTIIGVRAENYVQRHTGRDQAAASGNSSGNELDNDKVLDSFDLFPSVNIIYEVLPKQNIRASYTRTIARPSFKELSFAQIIDPISNSIFNGALFEIGDWDGNLTETRIDNADLRWELFRDRAQMYSASVFYKRFDNPIEIVRMPEQQTSTEYQPRNVGNGNVYGFELEFKKWLDFISPALQNFNISGNLTLVKSEIKMTDSEFDSRKQYEKESQTVEDTRQMAGQAPYVVNAGISYSNYEIGLDAGLFYNVKGPTLTIVGTGLYSDIYMEPFNSLNFTVSKKLGKEKNAALDLKISNILNERIQQYYTAYEADNLPHREYSPGVSVSLGFSYKF